MAVRLKGKIVGEIQAQAAPVTKRQSGVGSGGDTKEEALRDERLSRKLNGYYQQWENHEKFINDLAREQKESEGGDVEILNVVESAGRGEVPEWQSRVITEQLALDTKIRALKNFLANGLDVDSEQLPLLHVQLGYMMAYDRVLRQRITLIKKGNPNAE